MRHIRATLDIHELLFGRSIRDDGGPLSVDLEAHGIEVTEKRLLGKGVFNDVYSCLLRDGQGSSKQRVAIKHDGHQLLDDRPTTIQAGVGIDSRDARIIPRNIATSILDSAIGTSVVPRSASVVIDGQRFLAMTIAPGKPLTRCYRSDPKIIFDPGFQRRCNDIEVLSYLSGNPDIHTGNVLVHKAGRGSDSAELRVTLIDNDLAFGPDAGDPERMPIVTANNKRQYRHTGLPAYVDANTASRIRSMDRGSLSLALAPLLTGREIRAFEARLERLHGHIAQLKRDNRIVFDWRRFVNARDETLGGGDLITGTLELSGVLQGMLGKEEYFAPRSIIVRDCREGHLGCETRSALILGRERFAMLRSWAGRVEA